MSDRLTTKPPMWYWIVAVFAFLWNALGVYQYLIKAYNTEGFRSQYTAEQLEVIANSPSWATAAFAIGVFGGIIGSVFLLMKSRMATIFFIFSLLGVLVQVYHNHVVINSSELLGSTAPIFSGIIVVFALVLLWFSKYARKKTWLQ